MEPVDDFDTSDLATFIEDLRNGKIKPYMKSLPVPKKHEVPTYYLPIYLPKYLPAYLVTYLPT